MNGNEYESRAIREKMRAIGSRKGKEECVEQVIFFVSSIQKAMSSIMRIFRV